MYTICTLSSLQLFSRHVVLKSLQSPKYARVYYKEFRNKKKLNLAGMYASSVDKTKNSFDSKPLNLWAQTESGILFWAWTNPRRFVYFYYMRWCSFCSLHFLIYLIVFLQTTLHNAIILSMSFVTACLYKALIAIKPHGPQNPMNNKLFTKNKSDILFITM